MRSQSVVIAGVERTIPDDQLIELEDGSFEGYYLDEKDVNGVYVIDESSKSAAALVVAEIAAKATKAEAIETMKVTIGSGKVFYADAASRVDMASAIDGAKLKEEMGVPVTTVVWKLAEEFEGSKYAEVTLLEIREASALALETKASIVGVPTEGV